MVVCPSGIFYKPEEVSNELGVSEESLLRLAMAGKLVFSVWCPKMLTTNGIYSGWFQLLAEELLQANTWIMFPTSKEKKPVPIKISCAMADGQMLFFAQQKTPNDTKPEKCPILVWYQHLVIQENEFERFKSSIIKPTDQPEKKDDLVRGKKKIGKILGVDLQTVKNWQKKYKDFPKVIIKNKQWYMSQSDLEDWNTPEAWEKRKKQKK